jgi:hypothetical protein
VRNLLFACSETARVERTLLSVAFDFVVDLPQSAGLTGKGTISIVPDGLTISTAIPGSSVTSLLSILS